MTNDEIRMTKEIRSSNDESRKEHAVAFSSFVMLSFVIRECGIRRSSFPRYV